MSIQIVESYVQVYSPITLSQLNLINPGTFNVPRHLEYNRIVFSRSPFVPPLERRQVGVGGCFSKEVPKRKGPRLRTKGGEQRPIDRPRARGNKGAHYPCGKLREGYGYFPTMAHSRCMQKWLLTVREICPNTSPVTALRMSQAISNSKLWTCPHEQFHESSKWYVYDTIKTCLFEMNLVWITLSEAQNNSWWN